MCPCVHSITGTKRLIQLFQAPNEGGKTAVSNYIRILERRNYPEDSAEAQRAARCEPSGMNGMKEKCNCMRWLVMEQSAVNERLEEVCRRDLGRIIRETRR